MELSGKIIIFENEQVAKVWFKTIKEVEETAKVKSAQSKMDKYGNSPPTHKE